MTRYEIILFDADGTLLDFVQTEKVALQKTFAEHDFLLTPEIEERYGIINKQLWNDFENGLIAKEEITNQRFTRLFAEVGINYDGRLFNDEYLNNLACGYFTIPGAKEICAVLSKHCRLYFATNGIASTQFQRIDGSGLASYFQATFVSENAGEPKPSPIFFDYCFSQIPDFDRAKTLIIGDSLYSDIKGGQQAGIATCWFNPTNLEAKNNIKPDYIIHDLAELENIILL